MTGWVVLGIILALFLLLLWSRVRGEVIFGEGDLKVTLRFLLFHYQLFPMKQEDEGHKKKVERERKEKTESDEPEEEKGGTLSRFRELLSLILEVLGRLKRAVRIDRLFMRLVWGGEDPAAIAVGYGAANAAIGMIWPVLDNNFNIRSRTIETDVDFQQKIPTIFFRAKISVHFVSAVILFVHIIRKGLPLYRKLKLPAKDPHKMKIGQA